MGFAMAMNVRKKIPASSTLYINDINASACERFSTEYSSFGLIKIVATAREAAENANVLISIVPGGADVKTVYLEEKHGVIAARKNDERLMLECSTIDVESTKEVGRRLKEEGLGVYIDAPVSVRKTLHQARNCFTNEYSGRRACSRSWHAINAHRPPSTNRFIPVFNTFVQNTVHAWITV
jgi:3-hydroxyisobutyrate dehydrogenase-like beta-hydroxyacid dehydrogenase